MSLDNGVAKPITACYKPEGNAVSHLNNGYVRRQKQDYTIVREMGEMGRRRVRLPCEENATTATPIW